MENKKRVAVYNREADKRWNEKNKERRASLTARSTTRCFIRDKATYEDIEENYALNIHELNSDY